MRQAFLYYCCDFAMEGPGCDATSDAQSTWSKATAAAKAGGWTFIHGRHLCPAHVPSAEGTGGDATRLQSQRSSS
jgi:hypothetical protein